MSIYVLEKHKECVHLISASRTADAPALDFFLLSHRDRELLPQRDRELLPQRSGLINIKNYQ